MLLPLLLSWCAPLSSDAAAAERAVAAWLASAAVPLDESAEVPKAFDECLEGVRVLALGEATHGQHESFELKRRLTMHCVRERSFRLIAYEASSSRARACDDFIAGRSEDVLAAVAGLGLLFSIEENAALLDELRTWNALVEPEERVRFIGLDAPEPGPVAARLHELLAKPAPELAARAQPLGARVATARAALFAGDATAGDALFSEVEALRTAIEGEREALAGRSSPAEADEACRRARELARCLSSARSPAARDRGLAEALLEELAASGESTRAVVWAHNGHVTNGPLRYLESSEPGMGGVMRASIDRAWYAVGFLFGAGEFHALAEAPAGGYGFRAHAVSSAPAGSFEAPFLAAELGTAFVDLRRAPTQGEVAGWLDAGHGQRWFGGLVQGDAEASTRDVSALPSTVARVDFDGLVFLPRTTASRPLDPSRVLSAPVPADAR